MHRSSTVRNSIPIGLFLALLMLSSCATAPQMRQDDKILSFLSRLDGADVRSAVEVCGLPFVYDDEVLRRETDLGALWQGLKGSGFAFGPSRIARVDPVSSDAELSGGWDIGQLSRRMMGDSVSIARIETPFGAYEVLLEGRAFGDLVLRGIRGPL